MKKIIAILVFTCLFSAAFAQNSNTLYFMDEISTRNLMNPAFLPRCKSYFDFILLPNIYLGAGENAFAINDVFYKENGKSTTMLSSQAAIDKFLKNIPSSPYIKTDLRLNILNFGARLTRGHYLIFDFNLRNEENVFMPKDLFRFALTGMQDMDGVNKYDLSSFGVNSITYATAGIGYSGRLSDKVTFGFKGKFLLGLANASTTISQLELSASREEWVVNSGAKMNFTTPFPVNIAQSDTGGISFNGMDMSLSKLKPAGYGASFDIGVTYEPIKYLTISAAVVDLGFINWGKGYNYVGTLNGTYKYDGLGNITYGDTTSLNTQVLKELMNKMGKDVKVGESTESCWQMINGKFNVGVEYGILKNKISFGVMNQLAFTRSQVYDEVTLAVNFRPSQWFKAALSYSFLNGNWGTLGLGLNLNLGAFDLYLISDYIPITYTQVHSSKYPEINNIALPDRLQYFNLQFGTIFNIGRFDRDLDDDGVKNYRDKCPDTNMDFLRKKCPKMKNKELVDKSGCDRDEDHDGVNDCYDQCPGTPEGIEVDSVGCPVDDDKDGVPNTLDQCPETPEGVAVDSKGCPLDADADGVPDYLDQCPNTPQNVVVDERGCPVDSDNDGVADYLDKCPDTPEGVAVDSQGCPLDEDGDGVPDHLDQCPHTPRNVVVDSVGCPIDTDGDGIPDYEDKCPDRPGPASNYGCPEPTEIKNVFKQAMHGIQFETGKSAIKKASYPILDQIVALMSVDTVYSIEISGHTDNVGKAESNLKLSEDRAASVRQYLIDHGVSANRLTSAGYGDTQPIADNKTKKGRAENRRVEFNIVYERVTYKE